MFASGTLRPTWTRTHFQTCSLSIPTPHCAIFNFHRECIEAGRVDSDKTIPMAPGGFGGLIWTVRMGKHHRVKRLGAAPTKHHLPLLLRSPQPSLTLRASCLLLPYHLLLLHLTPGDQSRHKLLRDHPSPRRIWILPPKAHSCPHSQLPSLFPRRLLPRGRGCHEEHRITGHPKMHVLLAC